MNRKIKQVFDLICRFLTWVINQGQRLMCYRESHSMYRVPKFEDPKKINEEYKANARYLRQFGFKGNKRDFLVFRNYLADKGHDPKYIVPSTIVHKYLTAVLNPIPYNAYFSDKNMLDKIFPRQYLPKTLFRRMDGIWYDAEYQPIDFERCKEIAAEAADLPGIIVKPAKDSSSGRGVELFKLQNRDWKSFNGKYELFEALTGDIWGNADLIIQEALNQNDFLKRLSPTAVSTLRIVTYNSPVDSKVHLIWCGIRLGADGSVIDNNHGGGVILGVDKDGRLNPYATDQYGNKYSAFNNIDFSAESLYIPHYAEIIEFAKELTPPLLPNRFIAFDITIDHKGTPMVIEANMRGYGGWVCQFAGDYMFGEKTDEILQYLSEKKESIRKFFYCIN